MSTPEGFRRLSNPVLISRFMLAGGPDGYWHVVRRRTVPDPTDNTSRNYDDADATADAIERQEMLAEACERLREVIRRSFRSPSGLARINALDRTALALVLEEIHG
jgi:hypothetical protein